MLSILATSIFVLLSTAAFAGECKPGEHSVTTVHIMGTGELGGRQICVPPQKQSLPRASEPGLKVPLHHCSQGDLLVQDGHNEWCVDPKSSHPK